MKNSKKCVKKRKSSKKNKKDIDISAQSNGKKCDAHCLFFPAYVDKDVEYDCINGIKFRTNKIVYSCGYDGHVINHFCKNCINKKTFSDYKGFLK